MDLGREDRDDDRRPRALQDGRRAAMDLGREDRDDVLCRKVMGRKPGAAMDLGREDRDDESLLLTLRSILKPQWISVARTETTGRPTP